MDRHVSGEAVSKLPAATSTAPSWIGSVHIVTAVEAGSIRGGGCHFPTRRGRKWLHGQLVPFSGLSMREWLERT